MRKIKYLLYLLVLAFILVGCSQADMSGSGLENAPNNSTVETTRKIYYTVKYVITSTKCDEIKKNIEIEVKEYNGYISFSNENN